MGALKHMITSDRVRIEGKITANSYEIPNYCRMLITSNEEWVIPAGESERRFTVIDMSGARRMIGSTTPRSGTDGQGRRANLLHVLINTPLDFKLLSRPVNTAALRDQQLASMEADQRWLYDLLQAGSFPMVVWRRIRFTSATPDFCAITAPAAGRIAQQWASCSSAPWDEAGAPPRTLGGGGLSYQFPPLAECRAAFSVGLAVSPEWDDTTTGQPMI